MTSRIVKLLWSTGLNSLNVSSSFEIETKLMSPNCVLNPHCKLIKIGHFLYFRLLFTMDTFKRAATPVSFVYCFELHYLRSHMLLKAIKVNNYRQGSLQSITSDHELYMRVLVIGRSWQASCLALNLGAITTLATHRAPNCASQQRLELVT